VSSQSIYASSQTWARWYFSRYSISNKS
jgi:hypothetical protein